jgi:cytochrome P450
VGRDVHPQIPKGTLCISNLWQCNRDPAVYGDDVASFNPERFLDEHDKGHSSYGFGRQTCIGKHVANDSLFINMAMVLWDLRVEGPRDESGKKLSLDTESSVDARMVLYVVSILSAWMVLRISN